MSLAKIIKSSADPNKVSLTLKGTVVILLGMAIKQFDLPIDDTLIAEVTNWVWILGSVLTTGYGLLRKVKKRF